MDLQLCRLDVADFIATVTVDRPPVNAQNRRMREEIIWLFDTLSDRDDVRVVILTAAGKVFSAGADVKERRNMVKAPGDYISHNRVTREFFYAVADCSKPVIAAVNGAGHRRGLRLDAVLRHHAVQRRYLGEHARDRRWPRRRRQADDGAFRPFLVAADLFHRPQDPASELYRLGVISACVPRAELMAKRWPSRARSPPRAR